MSELRFNELRGEPVAYAIDRQERTFLPDRDHCPLCPTHPGGPQTEIPLPAYEIVVFDNRFPAFEPPHGAAEVVVYTDDHDASFGSLSAERAEALMWVWRHRYAELGARPDVEYVYIFENRGVEVGVTLHHPHGQIYGYPFLPPVPALELAADLRLGGCAVCAAIERERADAERILLQNDGVLAYVPRAARWPFEIHLSMAQHRPSLLDCEPHELRLLADGLQRIQRGYDALFDRPFPYVMAVHQAPTGTAATRTSATGAAGIETAGTSTSATGTAETSTSGTDASTPPDGHLHVEFYPPLRAPEKLKFLAGSEQGAGTFISDVLPEEASVRLREAIGRAG